MKIVFSEGKVYRFGFDVHASEPTKLQFNRTGQEPIIVELSEHEIVRLHEILCDVREEELRVRL